VDGPGHGKDPSFEVHEKAMGVMPAEKVHLFHDIKTGGVC